MTEWRAIESFSRYEINSFGKVRNVKSQRLVSQHPNDGGYYQVKLIGDCGVRKWVRVHSAVLTAFTGPRPSPKYHGAHGDGDKTNNYLSNLSWKLPTENESDKKRHGTAPKGTVPTAKRLSPEERKGALKLLSTQSHSAVARRYGVHRKIIARVAKRNGVESV